MAQRVARRVVHNPGRLSDKQIRFFGTPGQKAALKRRRSRRRNAGARKRTGGLFRRKAATKVHKARTRPRRVTHSNPGEILSLVANPAKRRKMAKAHRRRKRAASNPARRSRRRRAVAAPSRRHRRRSNPSTRVVYRRRRRHHAHGRRRRGNPSRSGGGLTGLFSNALWLVGGAVATKVVTQAILGAKNTGVFGYVGNAVAAFGLSLLVGKLLKNPAAGKQVLAGGIVALVLRLLSDFTPLGQYTSKIGMGDYQVSHWVTPQRYTDALNSADVEIPAGWAPRVIQSNAPPAGMTGMGDMPLYSGAGLYSAS